MKGEGSAVQALEERGGGGWKRGSGWEERVIHNLLRMFIHVFIYGIQMYMHDVLL